LPVPATSSPDGKAYVRPGKHQQATLEKTPVRPRSTAGGRRIRRFQPLAACRWSKWFTGPDLRTADEAAQYLPRLRQLLRWLGISEADMERGNLRCDANVSIRRKGETILNPKTEIKNVNSIENVREAILHEVERQIREVEAGNRIFAWTLEWDEDAAVLRKMRSKETEADYRYFREPDLLPIRMDDAWKADILKDFPELPLERRARFISEYGLPEYDAEILTGERRLSDYFEAAVKAYGGDAKRVSNWLMNDILRMLNEKGQTAGSAQTGGPAWLWLNCSSCSTTARSMFRPPSRSYKRGGRKRPFPAKLVEKEGWPRSVTTPLFARWWQEVLAENSKESRSLQGRQRRP
jgi:aspartyl-tRNA(Asn)/glutamyl-tRNA(Gln) amidotransferase subunit B